MAAETKDRLRKVLVESLDLQRDPATIPDTNLVNELGLDSINTIEFLIWVESEFSIEIADEDLSVDLIDDLGKLAEYVESRSQQAVTS
ncbi:MAG TPA: phosphopantetheine-binding protein [Actinophytocola sp.]|uniref:phosphopantetheine-binding protein n=1 Tax=Actinophytocola sp. TaxID=1872138 RepID=UPI002DBB3DFE|nr:phosphopantetheine-binding protein [Actinophytocola sp.]HEU5469381.1 phosphopantetheine-binding protein [Actinophytocola sp.]